LEIASIFGAQWDHSCTVGTLIAAIGKLFGQSGWFYRVIGPVAKAVDSDKIALTIAAWYLAH